MVYEDYQKTMQNAKPITIWIIAIASISIISYSTVSAYTYFTTTTIDEVRAQFEKTEKAKSDLQQIRNEYCNDKTPDGEKIDYNLCWQEINKLLSATGGISPVPWYTSKHSLVLTGSHSYVKYSNRLGASWKNNNSAGLTWWVSPTLKKLWTDAGIRYRKGSLRPANEKGNYIYFETVEEWLRAKIIAIRERWGKATVEHYLAGWGTDYLKLSFDQSKIIKDLSDAEFTELFVQQMKKESPGYTSQLVQDWILIIE